jgi:hypothetical protein
MIMLGLMWQSQMVTISLLLQTAKPQYQWAVTGVSIPKGARCPSQAL